VAAACGLESEKSLTAPASAPKLSVVPTLRDSFVEKTTARSKRPIVMVAACAFPANWGTPGAIRELSMTLSELGNDVHVVTYPFGEDLPVGGAKVWRTWFWRSDFKLHSGPSLVKLVLDFLLIFKLCRVIYRERIEIIHAHNYEGVLIGLVAKLITGRPLVYNSISLMSNELNAYGIIKPEFLAHWLARLLDWFVPKFPDRFIPVSRELETALISRGVAKEKITFIPCGIRREMFDQANPEQLRIRYQVGTRPIVIYTGINSPLQRIDYLLRAFSVAVKRHPESLLMAVSCLEHDPDTEANRELAKSLGIHQNVIWVEGQRLNELADYLALSSVAVLPRPDVAGHPIKLLNYMASSLPTVSFAGAAKGIEHMREAFIVPDHDWKALGDGIITLLDNPELAKRMGAKARETVLANFEWVALAKKVENVYEAVRPSLPVTAQTPHRPEFSSDALVQAQAKHLASAAEQVESAS